MVKKMLTSLPFLTRGLAPYMGTASQKYSSRMKISCLCSKLCLTIPGRVVGITGDLARVDYGEDGVREKVNISLVKAKMGDYVLVQSGFAVKLLSEGEAGEVLEMWKMIRELNGGDP